MKLLVRLRPVIFIAILLAVWQIAIMRHPGQLLPSPWQVTIGLVDLVRHGLLFKYVVASLFRVTWGFGLAVVLGDSAWARDRVVQAGGNGVESDDANTAADFSAGLDSDCDPVVRRRRSGGDLSHLPGLLFPADADGDQCRAEHPGCVRERGPKFRAALRSISCVACCTRRWCRS